MAGLFLELKRRNVFRVGVAYVVIGWLLVQVLEVLTDAFEAPGWVLKVIIALLAIGFLPVIAFSWVYELTPGGIKRESQIDRSASITRQTGHRLDMVTIAAVVIGALFVGWTHLSNPGTQTGELVDSAPRVSADALTATASVAVLPFVNMSASEENQYFADGLTETLLHMLAQLADVKVAARTSSFAFKGQDIDIRKIAATLNVAHVLEGSVQRAGERVRITAQLIRAADGFHVWSANYDRTLDDVFRIQDEIARDVRGALSSSLLGTDTATNVQGVATGDIEAYDLYLQALAERIKGSYGALQEAERLLKQALARDTEFLEARTELALVLWAQADTGLITRDTAIDRCEALLSQVLQRRPQDVRARSLQVVLEAFRSFFGGNIPAGFAKVRELALIAEQAPSEPLPREFLVTIYTRTDRLAEAREQLEVLLELDPLNPEHYGNLGIVFNELEEWDKARAAIRRSLEIEPEQPNAYGRLGNIDRRAGDIVGLVRNYEKAIELDPEDHELPAMVAETCYDYGLIAVGDRFKAKTDALAATSSLARKLELERASAAGNEAEAASLAREMLAENVDDRQGTWFAAVREFFLAAARDGTSAEALAFMEQHYPGYTDASRYDLPPHALFSRGAALGHARLAMSAQQFDAFLSGHRHFLTDVIGVNLEKDPLLKAELLELDGMREEAIELLLERVFTKPESRYHFVSDAFSLPHLAALRDDPRIAQALARYAREAQQNRQKLQTYFEAEG